MTPAHKLMTKALIALTASITLTACATTSIQTDANNDGVRDTTERPRFFGRRAWDRKHAGEVQQAEAPPAPAPVLQTAQVTQQLAPAPVPPRTETKPQGGLSALFSRPKPADETPASAAKQKPAPQVQTVSPQVAAAAPQPAPPPLDEAKPKRARLFPWAKAVEADKSAAKPTKPRSPVVVGGYGPATDKEAVAAAAAFALTEAPGYKFSAIYSAKVQVVAGTNYSLCLWVRRPAIEPNPFSRRMVAATVFQGLDKHYELISWREVEHCRAGSQ